MKVRESYYVSLKNPLTWIAALLLVSSAGLRIAIFCEKGAESTTMWMLCILPVAAAILYALNVLLDGREHLYRTLIPLMMMAVYFTAMLIDRSSPKRYVFLNVLVYLAFLIFYKQITGGHVNRPWLLRLMFLAALTIELYDAFAADDAELWRFVPDILVLLGGMFVSIAMRAHADEKYHPTWGDRADGRRIRTMPPMSQVEPYLMVSRVGSSNIFKDEVEITELEKYIREKRKQGLTGFGLNHVFIAAYVRCVSRYPAVNRFCSGQRVYSRGDDIQYCMTVKKEMTVESPDTCIKLHLKPTDTVYDVYANMEKTVSEVKDTAELDSDFDKIAGLLTKLPGPVFALAGWLLRLLDYFGLLPGFLLEVSPFHGSVFFTSMGSLGIPTINHHLYNFGNLPVFVSFGRKYRRNEITDDGTVVHKKYVDMGFTLDERICDGYYYAAVLKYLHRLLAHPELLDVPPETVVSDIP